MRNLLVVSALLLSSQAFSGALVDPELKAFSQGEFGAKLEKVMILFNTTSTGMNAPQRYNRPAVVKYLKDVTKQMVVPILDDIQNQKLTGVRPTGVYWINGSMVAQVTPLGLQGLARHPSVAKIYKNRPAPRDPIKGIQEGKRSRMTDVEHDYSVTSLGLDRLFKEKPTINGQGTVVGVVDTGVDANHEALKGKVVAFYNGKTNNETPPQDFDSHGTHVSGTIAGGDRDKNWIGVAPGAKLAVAGALIDYETMLKGMQWFIDIEKNPNVGQKVKAVSCSWNTGGAPDQEPFYKAIAAWEAAGILPVFSAGNSGPQPSTITPPHEYPGTFAVAAYGPDGKIASFSSRGPGMYKKQPTQKPDLAAPGVNINSSVPGGKYQKMNGTSMATPHVTGTAALLLQVNPQLNPAQIKAIIMKGLVVPSSMKAGEWRADWGFGRLNIYNAVAAAASFTGFVNRVAKNFFLNTLEDVDNMSIANASMGEVGEGADLYSDTDRTAWLNSNEIY